MSKECYNQHNLTHFYKRSPDSIMKRNLKRLLPVFIIIGITVVMSVSLYSRVMDREKNRCWQILRDSAKSVTAEIQMKFQDNITTLGLAANAMVEENRFQPHQISSIHLDAFEENTIFSRIDILYPDNTILYEDGTLQPLRGDISFGDISALGEHISHRMTDSETGNLSVYYYMPVRKNGETKAILTGVIDLTTFADIFPVTLYDGHAAICVIDSEDGNYILDTWHPELENAYDTPDRTRLKGYEDIDLKDEVRNLRTGFIAFESQTNGKDTYMCYTPVGLFNWELLVVSQEDIVFSNLLYMKKLMIYVGIIELILLTAYFIWNLYTVDQLAKSQKETHDQLEISNTLIHCVTELSSDKDINLSIQNLLEIILQYFHADRTYIFELDAKKDVLINTYECVKPGVTPEINNLQNVPCSLLPEWMENFYNDLPYYISDIENHKDTKFYELIKNQNITRLITVPLNRKGEVIGFVGVDNPTQFYDDATLLSSIQFFITNSLTTKKQQEQLKYMSYRDMLTALYNRNKYIQLLDSCQGKDLQRIGVAYIDLNGLKQINDKQGHEAGDTFISSAARVISSIFPENAYRIGGDEFVIIAMDMDQQQYLDRITLLKEKMQREQVSISIGSLWMETCSNLDQMLQEADQRMYEAKKLYYQTADRRTHDR